MEEAEIKDLLSRKRQYEAEYKFLSDLLEKSGAEERIEQEAAEIKSKITRINLWLELLPEDEAIVITRHLVDGIDVPRIMLEYEKKWSSEFAKTERTIKMYQSRALKRIVEFEKRMQALKKGEVK